VIRYLGQTQKDAVPADQILDALALCQGEAFLIIDPFEFLLVRANVAAGALLGRSPQDLAGSPAASLYSSQESFARFRDICARDLAPGRVVHAESALCRADGKPIQTTHTLTLAGDTDSNLIVDVFRPAGAELTGVAAHDPVIAARVARMGSLGSLAASIAHELSQPLTALLNYLTATDRLLRESAAHGPALEALRSAQTQAHRAADIVRRLNDFLRGKGPERHAVQVNEVVKDAIQLIEPELRVHRVRVQIDLEDGLSPVWADHVQLQQVVVNLIKNAIDAMAKMPAAGRQVVVRTRRAKDAMVAVSVQDRGPGVSHPDMARLFEPFFSTKHQGLGMGLPISRSIVSAHGGSLWAERIAEGGMVFHFTIPVYRPKADDSGTDHTRSG
jgi:signal transduction histidine kinase